MLFLLAAYIASFNVFVAIPACLALWAMLCVALIDYDTQTIPDVLSFIIAVCGVVLRIQDQTIPLLAVLIGGGFFAVQWLISRGKWVGSGDVLLGAALGVLLGTWELTLLAIWFAYVIGMLTIIALLPFRRLDMNMRLAFGPFLVAGGAIALLVGDDIIAFFF